MVGGRAHQKGSGRSVENFTTYGYPKTVTVTMFAVNGVPSMFELLARLTTGAFADATYSPTAAGSVDAGVHCNLSDTVSWGGIAAARQIDGTPVSLSDVSVTSSSGVDYENEYVSSVPEPSTSGATPVAVSALWLARRRSRGPLPRRAGQASDENALTSGAGGAVTPAYCSTNSQKR